MTKNDESTNTIQLDSSTRVSSAFNEMDSPSLSLDVEDAAIRVQKAFRGYKARTDYLYIPEYEVRRMIKDLDAKESGMCSCGYYVLFLFLYFSIIVLQRDMALSHSIDASLRDVTSDFADPSSISDVFDYLITLSMDIYNGDEVESSCNACSLFNDSSLGYVPEGYPELWECSDSEAMANIDNCKLYEPCFAGVCEDFDPFTESSVTYALVNDGDSTIDVSICGLDLVEYLMSVGITSSIKKKWLNETSQIGNHGWVGNRNKLLGGVSLVFSLRESEECNDLSAQGMSDYFPTCYSSKASTQENIDISSIDTHFLTDDEIEYHSEAEGYVILFDNGLFNYGPRYTLCSLQHIKDAEIMGQNTEWMEIVFYTYNGEDDGLYSLTKIKYDFEEGGKVSSQRTISAFPLRNMYQPLKSVTDLDRLILEIIFVIFSTFNFLVVVRDIRDDYKNGKTHRILWNSVRMISCILMKIQIIMWIAIVVWMCNFELTHVEVLTAAKIEHIVENVGEMLVFVRLDTLYNSLTVVNGSLALLVVFYTLRFHRQLSVVTDTLFHSLRHLAHFLVIFSIILLLFSAIHWVLFGPADDGFKNLPDSLASLGLATFGAFDYYSMKAISNPLGPIIFFGYQIIISLLMLNILLSIVLNAYEVAKIAEEEDHETIIETTINFIGRVHGRCRMLYRRVMALRNGTEGPRILPVVSPLGISKDAVEGNSSVKKKSLEQTERGPAATFGLRTLKRSKTTKKMKVTKMPIKQGLSLLRESPANDYTCFWYLRRYTQQKILMRLKEAS